MADLRHLVPSRNVVDKRGSNKGQPTKEPRYDNAEDQKARVTYGEASMEAINAAKHAQRDQERRDPMQATLKQLSALLPRVKLKSAEKAKK